MLSQEERDKLNQMIVAKMSDTSDLDQARESQNTNNLISNLGQAGESIFKARSMATGGQGVDSDFYKNLQNQGNQALEMTADKRREALKSMLFQKQNQDDLYRQQLSDQDRKMQLERQNKMDLRGEERDKYQREKDERDYQLRLEESKKRNLPDQNRYDMKMDQYGRTFTVDKRTGTVTPYEYPVDKSQVDQMQDDNAPPSPKVNETKQQYGARLKVWQDRQSADLKRSEEKTKLDQELEVAPNLYARTKDDAKKIKDGMENFEKASRLTQEMIALREKNGGGTIMNREDVAKGKQLAAEARVAWKAAANLGVLSQTDYALIDAVIPADPLKYDFVPGDPVLSNLKNHLDQSQKDFETTIRTRTKPIASESQQTQAKQQPVFDDEDRAAYEWAMKPENRDSDDAKRIIELLKKASGGQ